MRYVNIDSAKVGMMLARDLLDSFGRVLIASHTKLSDTNLEKLKRLGVEGIYINDTLSEDIRIEEVISPILKSKGMAYVKALDVNGCKEVSSDIVKQVLTKRNLSLDLTDLRTYDDYTYSHSVNVAVLSAVIALGLRLPETDISNIVLAGLLHDVGKLSIPIEIINKPSRLTSEEYSIIKNHAVYSYEKLKKRMDISAQVKQAILYHHENLDGSGYPNGVDASSLSLYARILHVADVYDALVSKRPYKEPYSSFEAIEYLMGGCGSMFDQNIVAAFMKYVPIYPRGTEVTLSDNRQAIIFDNMGIRNLRPVVRLVEDGSLLDLFSEENHNITIMNTGSDSKAMEFSERARNCMLYPELKNRIIYIDPDKARVDHLIQIAQESEVTCLSSGEEALEYLQGWENLPEAILLNVVLPGMDGVETTIKIQELTHNKIPIIFVTDLHDRETVLRCRNVNAAGYVVTPFKPLFLVSEIKRVVSGGEFT